MPPENQKKEPRLTNGTIGLMVGFALAADILEALIGLIPVVGWGVNIAIDLLVGGALILWFAFHRVNFRGTRLFVFSALALLKFIPGIEELPLWIMDVVAVSIMVRMEDKVGISAARGVAGAQKIARGLNAVVKNQRIAKLINNQRGIGGFLQKPQEKPQQTREQIIEKQKQLNEEKKERIAEPKKEKKSNTPADLPKKENPQPLPEIGKNSRQPTPEA